FVLRPHPMPNLFIVLLDYLPLLLLYFNKTPPTDFLSLSLHDALPISGIFRCQARQQDYGRQQGGLLMANLMLYAKEQGSKRFGADRKSTRLNSSHVSISYAVVC